MDSTWLKVDVYAAAEHDVVARGQRAFRWARDDSTDALGYSSIQVSHPFRNPHNRILVPLLVSPVAYFELVVLSSLKVRLTSAGKASGSAKASSKVPAGWR